MTEIRIHYEKTQNVDNFVEFEAKTLSLGWKGLAVNYINTVSYSLGHSPEMLDITQYKIESKAHAEAIIAALETAIREDLLK